jgi:hypothetical protein
MNNDTLKDFVIKAGLGRKKADLTSATNFGFEPDDVLLRYPIAGNLEKFAELIVQECAAIVANAVDHREPASTYAEKIKQHFGIE